MDKNIKIFKFNFSKSEIKELRNQSNEDYNCISEIEISSGKKRIFFWNQYCAILSRIDETIDYLNSLKLATKKYSKHAFDLYAFISQADVIIQAIRILGKTFKLEDEMKGISDLTECFGNVKYYDNVKSYTLIKEKGTDQQFWEYLRSITTVHPNKTNKSNFLHSKSTKDKNKKNEEDNFLLHVSPYAMWEQYNSPLTNYDGDINIKIYLGDSKSFPRNITVNMEMIVNFIKKWISFLDVVSNKIVILKDERIERLKNTPLKDLNDFDGKIQKFIEYLELEYKKRYRPDLVDDDNEKYFSKSIINFFETKFDNQDKQKLLNEFLAELINKLAGIRNSIQSMIDDSLVEFNISPSYFAEKSNFPGISDFVYQFEKIEYINEPYISPNENYQQSDLEKKILLVVDGMIKEKKPVVEISNILSELDGRFNLDKGMWGRLQAYLIANMLLKDDTIDFTLNHWKVYVQLVLSFWNNIRQNQQ